MLDFSELLQMKLNTEVDFRLKFPSDVFFYASLFLWKDINSTFCSVTVIILVLCLLPSQHGLDESTGASWIL